jgi:hypothetical protein
MQMQCGSNARDPARHRKLSADLELWITLLRSKKRPMTVSQEDGRHRSVEQNKLQRLWCNEVSEQLGDHTPEEARAISKLEIAVPILRAEDEA